MFSADLIFAVIPILVLIYWMTKASPMPSAKALPLAAVLAYGIRLGWFGTDAKLVQAAVIAGLLMAWTPILIVWGAIFLFHTMEQTGAMETIRRWLNALSRNRVAQVVIIGWSFQFPIEGASGFGTPAALAGPLAGGARLSAAASRDGVPHSEQRAGVLRLSRDSHMVRVRFAETEPRRTACGRLEDHRRSQCGGVCGAFHGLSTFAELAGDSSQSAVYLSGYCGECRSDDVAGADE